MADLDDLREGCNFGLGIQTPLPADLLTRMQSGG